MKVREVHASPGEEIEGAARRALMSVPPGWRGVLIFNDVRLPFTRPGPQQPAWNADYPELAREIVRTYYMARARIDAAPPDTYAMSNHAGALDQEPDGTWSFTPSKTKQVTAWVAICPRPFCGWNSRPYLIPEDAHTRRRRHLLWRHFVRRTP